MDNTCKNCKNYRPSEKYQFGICKKVGYHSNGTMDRILVHSKVIDEENIKVGENFGCIHFEQK